jgi:hypothetical protein
LFRLQKYKSTCDEKESRNQKDVPGQSYQLSASSGLTCSTAGNSPEPPTQDDSWDGEEGIHLGHEPDTLISQRNDLVSVSSKIWPCLPSPEEFGQMERLLFAVRNYFDPSSQEFRQTIVREDLLYSQELQEFELYVHNAAICADLANWEKAAVKYDKALANVPEILRGRQSLNFLICLFIMFGCCETTSRSAFIPAMLGFVSKLAAIIHPPHHPFRQLIDTITKSLPQVSEMIEVGLNKALEILISENLGFDPRTRIVSYGLYESLFSKGKISQARELFRELHRKEVLLLGKQNIRTICSMMDVAKCAIMLGDFVEAEKAVDDIIQRMQLVTDGRGRYHLRLYIQVRLKSCKQLQRKGFLHHQLINAFNNALDDSAYPPALSQHDNWLHIYTDSSSD